MFKEKTALTRSSAVVAAKESLLHERPPEHDIQNENTHCLRNAHSQKTNSFFGACNTAHRSAAV